MTNSTDIFSLETTLSAFFDCVTKSNQTELTSPFLQAMTSIFHGQTTTSVIPFNLDDESTAEVIDQLKEHLAPYCPETLKALNMPLTYLLDELICSKRLFGKELAGHGEPRLRYLIEHEDGGGWLAWRVCSTFRQRFDVTSTKQTCNLCPASGD